MIFNVSFITAAGNTTKPWSGYSLIGLKTYATATGETMAYSTFIPYCFVIFAISILIWVLCAKLFFKIDVERLRNFDYTSV